MPQPRPTDTHLLGTQVVVRIEVPRYSLVKWGARDGIDFVSPVPNPFNYGSLPDTLGEDGDPLDAIVLGPRLHRGHTGRWPVVGIGRFVDQGARDDKLICSTVPLSPSQRRLLAAFFHTYALVKRPLGWVRRRGPTRFEGMLWP